MIGTLVQYPQKMAWDYTKAQLAFFRKRNRRIERLADKLRIEGMGLGTLHLLDCIDRFLELPPTKDNYQTEERIERAETAYEALPEEVKKARRRIRRRTYC